MIYTDELIGERFLSYARRLLVSQTLDYAEPPARLTGGYFTSVYAFRFAGAPAAWSYPLVLRVFPDSADPLLVRRERAVQSAVASAGFPAPRVLASDDSGDVLGRRFLVMERLTGESLLGGVEVKRLLMKGTRMLRLLPRITAETQARLHELDAGPLLRALHAEGIDRDAAGPKRWLDDIGRAIESWSLNSLRPALQWLIDNRPPEPDCPSICHGDLWPGNILVAGANVSGVIDWSLVTVGDAALDVGFTLAAFQMAPVHGPALLQRVVTTMGRGIAKRFIATYRTMRSVDDAAVRYYAALRSIIQLQYKLGEDARAASGGAANEALQAWKSRQLEDYFSAQTGVVLKT
jgi:aminoglycoside phosphotransferase (APT) family kinase protein